MSDEVHLPKKPRDIIDRLRELADANPAFDLFTQDILSDAILEIKQLIEQKENG